VGLSENLFNDDGEGFPEGLELGRPDCVNDGIIYDSVVGLRLCLFLGFDVGFTED